MSKTPDKMLTLAVAASILILSYGIFKAMPYWRGIQPALFTDDEAAKRARTSLSVSSSDRSESSGPFTVHPEFQLDIFTEQVSNPRVMIEDAWGNVLVSEPSLGQVTRISPEGNAEPLLTGLNRPHGLTLSEGNLYVAETGQVIRYRYDDAKASDPVVLLSLPAGGRHWTRTIGIGPDGALYISIGSSCNICVEDDWRRDKILRYDLQTEALETYASGLRNAVFFAWHPRTNEMYATEMGRDLLGDDIPPDELNNIVAGGDYGFPYCYGNNVIDPEFNDPSRCQDVIPSHFDFAAHEAPLGIDFFHGDAIVALHGSWNRTEPIGYGVIRLSERGKFQQRESILSGFLQEDGTSIGRPAGILVTSRNDILIADDAGGVIYRLRAKK